MAPKARGLPSSSASTAKPPKTSSAAKIALEERWRPMVIESTDGLSSADFAGLVGLEELNPADFDGELKIIRGGRGAKRASTSEEPLAKKKKKKQQQKSRKISASISEATTVDLNASDEEDAKEEDQISATDKLLNSSSNADPSWAVEALPAKPSVPDHHSSSVEENDDHVAPESVSCTSKLSDQWSSLGVPSHILTRLAALNLTVPTPIQVATIPSAISQDPATRMESIYGAAPTGSGKTLAFAIPMVAQIVAQKNSTDSSTDPRRLRGLVLTPTRELAVQIKKHIEAITTSTSGNEGSSVRTALVVGGLAIQKQERILARQQPDIVVATPGRLWEIVSSGSVPFLDRSALQAVHFLVIDEADRMVEKGHFEELKQLIGLLNQAQSSSSASDLRQTYIFSATLMLAKKSSKRTKLKHRKKSDETPNLIELLRLDQSRLLVVDLTEGGRKSTPAAEGRLQEQIIHCLKEEKDVYLYYFLLEQQQNSILNTSSKSIVFANSIDCLRRLLNLLRFLGLSPLVVHSSMPQKRRLTAIERFTSNEHPNSILLATDVAARGLDIPSVAAVIHYQCPRSAEIYVHRSGRTARGGRATGRSLILCDPAEEAFFLRDFCRILGKNSTSAGGKSDLIEYPINSKALRRCKERVRLATLCDSLEHGLRKERSQLGWFKEAARAAEMDDSEEEESQDEEEMDAAVGHGKATQTSSLVNGRKLKAYERQLKALLRCSIVFPS